MAESRAQGDATDGPWLEAMRRGDFAVVSAANCHGIPNPVLDVQRYLPGSVFKGNYALFEDPDEVALYEKMLHAPYPGRQPALMRELERYVLDTRRTRCGSPIGIAPLRPGLRSGAGRCAEALPSTR